MLLTILDFILDSISTRALPRRTVFTGVYLSRPKIVELHRRTVMSWSDSDSPPSVCTDCVVSDRDRLSLSSSSSPIKSYISSESMVSKPRRIDSTYTKSIREKGFIYFFATWSTRSSSSALDTVSPLRLADVRHHRRSLFTAIAFLSFQVHSLRCLANLMHDGHRTCSSLTYVYETRK